MSVILAHSLAFRFESPQLIGRLAEPLAEMGVQLFFVISGFIITTLLLREENTDGQVDVLAFYVRRSFRILPPLMAYYGGLLLLRWQGAIDFETASVASSALFSCNTGFTTCEWWVAHTWSLAVEEQYYLCWPLLFVLLPRRPAFLTLVLAALIVISLWLPYRWHSNSISFACIAMGALYASSRDLQSLVAKSASYATFFVAGILFAAIPLFPLGQKIAGFTPLLVMYFLFSARELPLVKRLIESFVLNAVGLCSYSLYLWQQLFLGQPSSYLIEPFHLAFLPLVVFASYQVIEKPMARLGHRLSSRIKGYRAAQVTLT